MCSPPPEGFHSPPPEGSIVFVPTHKFLILRGLVWAAAAADVANFLIDKLYPLMQVGFFCLKFSIYNFSLTIYCNWRVMDDFSELRSIFKQRPFKQR
jgi:hypothetical protein